MVYSSTAAVEAMVRIGVCDFVPILGLYEKVSVLWSKNKIETERDEKFSPS